MKKLFVTLCVCMGAVAFLGSCEKLEQTSLEANNAGGKAVVCGYLTYDSAASASTFGRGKSVFVDVSLTSLNPEIKSGYTRYTTITDNKGFYSVNIPTPKGQAVTFNLSSDFTAKYLKEGSQVTAQYNVDKIGNTVLDGNTTHINLKAGQPKSFPNTPNLNK